MTNKMEVEDQHHLYSYSFMPLLSRVDCLDSAMKDVEKKKHKVSLTWRNGTRNLLSRRSKKGMLLTAATSRDVSSNSSLMDRIRSLEARLLQLSKEIDQVNTKASSSFGTRTASLWTISSSSSAQIKSELPVSSYPTSYITQESKQSHEYFQRDVGAPPQMMKDSDNDTVQQQQKQKSDNDEEKACIDGKKKRSPCWRCMKLLGC